MFSYDKTVQGDFQGNEPNLDKLHDEIKNSTINKNFTGLERTGDIISIIFEEKLTGDEQTILNSIVVNHVRHPIERRNTFFTVPKKFSIKTNGIYTQASVFNYIGSNHIGPVNYIEILTYKDPSIESYDARIICRNTGYVLTEKKSITNNEIQVIDMGSISYAPNKSKILELQIKKNGGRSDSCVHGECIIIYYGN